MICRACRTVHKGPPPECPDCGCQHRGELPKPEVQREPLRWSCTACGTVILHADGECDCEVESSVLRHPVYEDDLEERA